MRDYGVVPALYPDAVNSELVKRFAFALADAASDADPATPIPTCGDWTLDDLLWHLTQVQEFWSFVIATRPSPPQNYEPSTRTSGPRQIAGLKNAATGLAAVLAEANPAEAAWSWAVEQTVAFSIRRQTHEALTHCVDGLLALDLPLPEVSPQLAADGVDEIVHVMLESTAQAAAAEQPAVTGTVVLHATDTDDQWTINIGEGDCTIAGAAFDLNLWLWGRGRTWALAFTGAVDQADTLRTAIANDTQ